MPTCSRVSCDADSRSGWRRRRTHQQELATFKRRPCLDPPDRRNPAPRGVRGPIKSETAGASGSVLAVVRGARTGRGRALAVLRLQNRRGRVGLARLDVGHRDAREGPPCAEGSETTSEDHGVDPFSTSGSLWDPAVRVYCIQSPTEVSNSASREPVIPLTPDTAGRRRLTRGCCSPRLAHTRTKEAEPYGPGRL